ncbi:hypothetical protein RHMOL_Rhmol05G0214100 [Rhododendron molle]|uniref:Uncharacterized protein n=1 Tax=Rhododendron molle TaxID=49168 RepID=A0ACC0NT51_RHOML|nr:hypothetical protein RHMOL_Rhmol05G0214100 [Rhododendron molle]
MSVACLEGPTLTEFVEDVEAFDKCVDEQFNTLDTDDDGELSRSDLETRQGRFSSMEFELQSKEEITSMYDTLFEAFDADGNGMIDREEFRSLMREIVLAKARGIGLSPVLIILQGDSLLMRAVEHGLAKSN